jgi:hypothetical protein
METARSSEIFVRTYPTTQLHIPEECYLETIAVPYWAIFMVFSLAALGIKVNSHCQTNDLQHIHKQAQTRILQNTGNYLKVNMV